MRVFVGIRPPPAVLKALGEWAAKLRGRWSPGAVRWSAAESVHLTLRFLGDSDEQAIEALRHALVALGRQRAPFKLSLTGLDAFPNRSNPRVLWLGLAGDLGELSTLQEQLEERVQELGWLAEERPFRPHLTLGRVRQGQQVSLGDWVLPPPNISFVAAELELIESRLQRHAVEYHTLCRVRLAVD